MNIQIVGIAASGPCTFTCRSCRRHVNQAHENVYADLDGTPWTYMCPLCAGEERRLARPSPRTDDSAPSPQCGPTCQTCQE